MIIDETKITSFQTICTIVLRELRVERRLHQAVVADQCGKPRSFWEKIEAGKSKLDFDVLLRACWALDVAPSLVMGTAERYTFAMKDRGWSVVFTDLGGADALLNHAIEYWDSPGHRAQQASMWVDRAILDTPWRMDNVTYPGWYGLKAVFEYAVNEDFRAMQNDKERFKPLPSALDLAAQNGVNGGGGVNGVNGDPQGI
ncbi:MULTISPECIES: helix-turn-helix domain-containing protein [Burkholderia]|uniref:helix-turn-helix domain-containing protein n=1 Tax=Burkholderia TaxID=32008 RepID=UPI00163ED742|nr:MULTISPECIES: helix-turn-helix transcriptional regulator [Burkholderia]